MHKERLIQIAEMLENEDALRKCGFWFDMSSFLGNHDLNTDCGTAGCIAGLAYMLDEHKKPNVGPLGWLSGQHVTIKAQEYLGLTPEQAEELFVPQFDPEQSVIWENDDEYTNSTGDLAEIDLIHVRAKQAAQVIRHLVETGKVDWTIVSDELWENAMKS